MTVSTVLVIAVTVLVIITALALALRPRRRRLVNRGRRRGGYRRRRADRIKQAAAADIALIRGNGRSRRKKGQG